jgi:crotonobetainyl-CoA:carnitine CoA-transferase CaiB-like acyl-CoA transferase
LDLFFIERVITADVFVASFQPARMYEWGLLSVPELVS